MSPEELDLIERTGYNENGLPMLPKKHSEFRKAKNWQPGEEIPYDWSDF